MTKNEEVFLGLSYWVASLDGNFDISEKEFIEKSDSFKSFYTADNFEYCKKNVIESSKNKDTKQFISEYLDGLNLSKEESKKLVTDLCEIGASDGDFDDIEKKYIGFVIEALGLENEKIIESFEKPKKNKNLVKDTSINSLDVPRSLLFAKKEEELIPVVKQKIQNHIEKKLSIKGFDLSISDLKINKTKKLSTRVLHDNREIEEDLEINYSGAIESRTVSKSSINLFESNCSGNPPTRQDYEFKNLLKVKKFRVDGTNERVTCSKCSGLRKVPCNGCSGDGKNPCSSCNGRGDNDCSNCTAGERHCYSCGGDGRTSSYDYDLQRDVSKTCSSCAGRGRNPCGTCGRTGRVGCSPCSRTGLVTCDTCSGRGEIPCSRCDAQGSFTYFLRISSKLLKKENSSFIDGEPDKQYITKNLGTEEFEYSKLFGKYELSKLKEHAPELKNLFKVIKFDSAQKPKKIRFDLEDCASMSFVITVAGNVYVGGLNNEGKLYFDETILDQLFFNIIKTLDVDNSFKSIESIKSPVLVQIPNFNETYEKIGEYKTLRKIVESTQKNEVKLNKVRKLKNIDTSIYSKFLIGKIINKYRFISIVAALISHLPLWFFYPLISTVIAVLLIVVFFQLNFSVSRYVRNIKRDILSLHKSWRKNFIIMYLLASVITISLGENEDFYYTYFGENLPVFDPFRVLEFGIDDAFLSVENKEKKQEIEMFKKDSLGLFHVNDFLKSWVNTVKQTSGNLDENGSLGYKQYDLDLYYINYEPSQYIINDKLVKEKNYLSLNLFKNFKKEFKVVDVKKFDNRLSLLTDSLIILRPTGLKNYSYYIKEGSDYTIDFNGQKIENSKNRVYIDLSDEGYKEVKSKPYSKWRFNGLGDEVITYGENIEQDRENANFGYLYLYNSYDTFYDLISREVNHFKIIRTGFTSLENLSSIYENDLSQYIDIAKEKKIKEEFDKTQREKRASAKRALEKERLKKQAIINKNKSEEAKRRLIVKKRLEEEAKKAAKKREEEQKLQKKQAQKSKVINSSIVWYSTEKKSESFSRPLKKLIRKIKRELDIELRKIDILKPNGVVNEKDAITAYYFKNNQDLELFKKNIESFENVNLYYQNKNFILYYISPNNYKLN